MATIKSYSDLQQSKKLAEILSLESADMIWANDNDVIVVPYDMAARENVLHDFIPCWSLAALFSILPNNEHITTSVSRGSWHIDPVEYLPNTWWCEYEDSKSLTEFNISADNPVDACYEMIIRLNELNLL